MSHEALDRSSLLARIDKACDRFEVAWQSGGRPSVEEFLRDAPPVERPALKAELVKVDVRYRRRSGDSPQLADYFPSLDSVLEVFADPSRAIAGSTSKPASPDARTAPVGGTAADGTIDGRYRILRPHAKGGLGQVSVAHDAELHRDVAFKQIQERFADDHYSRGRFLREATITGGLEHPGIVPVYSLGQDDRGRPYYAMRFIRGESLRQASDRFHGRPQPDRSLGELTTAAHESTAKEPISPSAQETAPAAPRSAADFRSLEFRQLLNRFVAVCQAVAYAHSKGAIHRDLKPANIMLGEFGETLVVDWGLAKLREEGRGERGEGTERRAGGVSPLFPSPLSPLPSPLVATQPGAICGTPGFMSPEQAQGESAAAGPAGDVYSLGATLYYVLTGRSPLDRDDDIARMLARTASGDLPPPRSRLPRVPKALDAICTKAMSLKPGDRYATPAVLAGDIERWLADESVSAYREPLVQRGARWVRRHRSTSLAAAAVLLVLAVAGPVVAYRESRLRAQETWNYEEARRAIDNYVDTVTNAELLRQPEFKPLMIDLLKDARSFYERMAQRMQGRPQRLEELADSSFHVADLSYESGSLEEARLAWGETIHAYRELVRRHPQVVLYQDRLASSYSNLGSAQFETDERSAAMENFTTACEIWSRLLAADPESLNHQSRLAQTIKVIGLLQSESPNPSAARASFRRAIDLQADLVARDPGDSEYQTSLASSYEALGRLETDEGDWQAAVADFTRAIEIQRPLSAARRSDRKLRNQLGWSLQNLGAVQERMGQLALSMASCRESLEIREKLASDHPTITDYQHALAWSHYNLGALLFGANDLAGAHENWTTAVSIRGRIAAAYVTVGEFQYQLANTQMRLADLDERLGDVAAARAGAKQAVVTLERLVSANPGVPMYAGMLAWALELRAEQQATDGDSPSALANYLRARDLCETLVAEDPKGFQHRTWLVVAHLGIGDRTRVLGRPADALIQFNRALDVAQPLLASSPDSADVNVQYALVLEQAARAHRDLIDPLAARRRLHEAEPYLQHALTIAPKSYLVRMATRSHRTALAETNYTLGDDAGAAAAIQEFAAYADVADDYFSVSRFLCDCVVLLEKNRPGSALSEDQTRRRDEYLESALAMLHRAFDAGYDQFEQLRLDPGFGPLRSTPEFEELMKQFER